MKHPLVAETSGQSKEVSASVSKSRQRRELRELLGQAPNPHAAQQQLSILCEADNADTRWLIASMLGDDDLRERSLRELLPGLGLVESPHFAIRLSVRAANCLARAEISTLAALAGMTPASIYALPEVGVKTTEEILLVAVDEWASSYLALTDESLPSAASEQAPPGGSAADAERERLIALADAFLDIERASGFVAFRRRQLDSDRPSQPTVAQELGVSVPRISQNERAIRELLRKKMKDSSWPISSAVAEMREKLGSVALRSELEDVLTLIDPTTKVLFQDLAYRQQLLLLLADYRLAGEWVFDADISSLTRGVLNVLTEHGPVDLAVAGRHLAKLGVREDIQIRWIAAQSCFRVLDGEIHRAK